MCAPHGTLVVCQGIRTELAYHLSRNYLGSHEVPPVQSVMSGQSAITPRHQGSFVFLALRRANLRDTIAAPDVGDSTACALLTRALPGAPVNPRVGGSDERG